MRMQTKTHACTFKHTYACPFVFLRAIPRGKNHWVQKLYTLKYVLVHPLECFYQLILLTVYKNSYFFTFLPHHYSYVTHLVSHTHRIKSWVINLVPHLLQSCTLLVLPLFYKHTSGGCDRAKHRENRVNILSFECENRLLKLKAELPSWVPGIWNSSNWACLKRKRRVSSECQKINP